MWLPKSQPRHSGTKKAYVISSVIWNTRYAIGLLFTHSYNYIHYTIYMNRMPSVRNTAYPDAGDRQILDWVGNYEKLPCRMTGIYF